MPPAPVKTAANGKAKETHKHQISQAIPRNKRDNGGLSRPEAAPASSRSTQGGTQEGIREGTRKSVRAQAKKASCYRYTALPISASKSGDVWPPTGQGGVGPNRPPLPPVQLAKIWHRE
jgi:hypothetical protein